MKFTYKLSKWYTTEKHSPSSNYSYKKWKSFKKKWRNILKYNNEMITIHNSIRDKING